MKKEKKKGKPRPISFWPATAHLHPYEAQLGDRPVRSPPALGPRGGSSSPSCTLSPCSPPGQARLSAKSSPTSSRCPASAIADRARTEPRATQPSVQTKLPLLPCRIPDRESVSRAPVSARRHERHAAELVTRSAPSSAYSTGPEASCTPQHPPRDPSPALAPKLQPPSPLPNSTPPPIDPPTPIHSGPATP